jgi:anhydro-N-acetylmuramic acid kinase
MPQSFEILGLMSGSSLDGLDLAWCRFYRISENAPFSYEILAAECRPFPQSLKDKLVHCREMTAIQLIEAEVEFLGFSAAAIKELCQKVGHFPLAVASHGHTVFHDPSAGYSVQIGNGGILSGLCGLPVVCDFRTLDVGLGGQGAPLVPGAEAELFSEYDACLNLGGICNISFPKGANARGFDIGPCNQLLNFVSLQMGFEYDAGGQFAVSGNLIPELLKALDAVPYYNIPSPKSLSNESVAEIWLPLLQPWMENPCDVLHTLCQHIATKIVDALPLGGRLLVSGGGAFNSFLMEQLSKKLGADWHIELGDENLAGFKEALCFAWLGLKRLLEEENVPASVTGARQNSVSGALYGINPISKKP